MRRQAGFLWGHLERLHECRHRQGSVDLLGASLVGEAASGTDAPSGWSAGSYRRSNITSKSEIIHKPLNLSTDIVTSVYATVVWDKDRGYTSAVIKAECKNIILKNGLEWPRFSSVSSHPQ
ncbi:hypothetical protein J6590_024232 [Homalodisca vitripennis]|nr:hypothetical protein J6590_024232 [Homalodisca vitripennis]